MSFRNYKAKLRRSATMRKQSAHGLIPCPYCGGDIQDDPYGRRLVCSGCRRTWPTGTNTEFNRAMQQLHPGNLDTRDCPRCGSKMHWRDGVGLGRMWPDGAWECSNQRCWHMAGPGEMVPDTYEDPDAPGDLTVPEDWKMSGSRQAARLSGMDDPQSDPSFDQERAQMPEQQAQDQQNIVDGLEAIRPEIEEMMRTRGINEPDWGPLEAVIPPSHLGDWMWMGYGKNGQREYKHWATRRYLKLRPREEIPEPETRDPTQAHLYRRPHVPYQSFRLVNGQHVEMPVDMNSALGHAYDGVDQLMGTNGQLGTHPYPQGYPSTEWEGMAVPPWERPPYSQQEPGPSDFDPYADQR